MPDGTTETLALIWEWFRNVLIFVLGIFGYQMRTQARQIEEMQQEMIKRSEVTGSINNLRAEIQQGFMHLGDRIDRLKDKN